MPELPDVEIFARYFKKNTLNQRIGRLSVLNDSVLQGTTSPQALGRRLSGHSFTDGERHGKYLFGHLGEGNGSIVFHFGMTGFLKYYERKEDEPEHARLIISFDNGKHLAFDCQRMFGEVDFTDDAGSFIEQHGLGPDALKVGWTDFEAILGRKKGSIKSALMDQSALAGIGNVYSDEILFHAGIDPRLSVAGLGTQKLRRVFDAVREVLQGAIKYKADPERMPDSWLTPRRDKQSECPRCGKAFAPIKVQQRSAYVCTRCQQR